tara:strand:- start:1836 stop:2369 length:534 start_codon:yes stop_codon:yes gene_type:complete
MQAHINELHYDNSGADTGEAVEVAGPAGLSLDGSSIVFYSSGGSQYKSTSLSGTIPDCGALSFEVSGIQNGVCGLVLVAADGTLGPLLSYEGVLTATEGPAAGVTSTDIGVAESSATPVGSRCSCKATAARGRWAPRRASAPSTRVRAAPPHRRRLRRRCRRRPSRRVLRAPSCGSP